MENECKVKRFKFYAVYSRVRLFWIYITVNFFKTFFSLLVCMLKIFSILKKKKKNYKQIRKEKRIKKKKKSIT